MCISLRPSTSVMGVKCQSGVIWGHWGRKVIFAKIALPRPWYIAWPYDSYMSISLKPSIFVSGSNVNLGSTWGHPGRVRRLWRQQILVLSSSGNTSFSHTSRHLILTKLGHSDRYLNHYSRTNNDGVRGHDGVTGVKNDIFTKKASSRTECVAWTRDLCICVSLTPSTKVITLKVHPGSLGVTGVKRSFSPRRHQVLQNA